MFNSGTDFHIRAYDINNSGTVDEADLQEELRQIQSQLREDDSVILPDGTRYRYDGDLNRLQGSMRNAYLAQAATTVDRAQVQRQIDAEQPRLVQLENEVREAQEQVRNATTQEQAQAAERQLQQAQERLAAQINRVNNLHRQIGTRSGIPNSTYRAAGIDRNGDRTDGARANVSMHEGTANTGNSQMRAMNLGPATPAGFSVPQGWGAQSFDGMQPFSTAAYLQSMMMEDQVLGSFDNILKNQSKGKQLMMLFFYFAKMAESGDMGAMYQFMKFITYVITKDKAQQQIDMGKKLIELQDLSRACTQQLLDHDTDASDPNSSTDFSKLMTKVQSDTSAISTSQKLIAQMMEEFAQVSEVLNNTTKSALDTQGRILRTISTMR